ncbi:Canalicular multispecific organic anion transporter 2 [Sorochytrium milnesiophthora]
MQWCPQTFAAASSSALGFRVSTCKAQVLLQTVPSLVMLCTVAARLVYVRRRPAKVPINTLARFKLACCATMSLLSLVLLIHGVLARPNDGSLVLSTASFAVSTSLAGLLSHQEHVVYGGASMVLACCWLLRSTTLAISLTAYREGSLLVMWIVLTALSVLITIVEGCWPSAATSNAKLAMLGKAHSSATDDLTLLPEHTASPLSRATYSWIVPLMSTGRRRPLTMQDAYRCGPKLESDHLHRKHARLVSQRSSSARMLLADFVRQHYVTLLVAVLANAASLVFMFVVPPILKLLMAFMQQSTLDAANPPAAAVGYWCAAAMFLASILRGVFQQQGLHLSLQVAVRVQATLMNAIYHKAMRLSLVDKQEFDAGGIVNCMSVDAQTIAQFLILSQTVWTTPVTVVVAVGFLYRLLGVASLCGLGIVLVLLPVLAAGTRMVMAQQRAKMANMDKRMKLMSEIISGMRMIKLYAYESYFVSRVLQFRDAEQLALRTVYRGYSVIYAAMLSMPVIMALVSFGIYAFIGPKDAPLNSTRIFLSLSYFKIVEQPLNSFFGTIDYSSRAMVAFRRIAKFMESPEVDLSASIRNADDSSNASAITIAHGNFAWSSKLKQAPSSSASSSSSVPPPDSALMGDTSSGTCSSGASDDFSLHDINLRIPRGSLTAIAGRIGQGKSSLLHAILGQMARMSGEVTVNGTVAYVAQSAWIVNGTVCENIVMDLPFDTLRYQRTLAACALLPDLQTLSHGDQTPIGDRGVNLSGGQRARISLARAVYADADIYLLDDCLSAVDAHVDRHIFSHVIGRNGLLAGKTVLLVTHGVHHLAYCDHILLLQNGRIDEHGTFAELSLRNNGSVATLVREYAMQHKNASVDSLAASDVSCSLTMVGDESAVATQRPAQPVPKQVASVPGPADDNRTGTVSWRVFWYYASAMGLGRCAVYAVIMCAYIAATAGSGLWLTYMANVAESRNAPSMPQLLGTYAGLAVATVLLTSLSLFWSLTCLCIPACRTLHRRLLSSVMRAPMSWFDQTPAGRILNRFSLDMTSADTRLALLTFNCTFISAMLISTVVLIVVSTFWVLVVLAILFVALYFVQSFYLASSRELKRLDSGSKAPIYQLFGESVSGIVTIRAYGYQAHYTNMLERRVDNFVRATYLNYSATRWLNLTINNLGSVVILAVAVIGVLTRYSTTGASIGLGVTMSQQLVMVMGYMSTYFCEMENQIISVERIRAYSSLEAEAAQHDAKVEPSWPSHGAITFEGYSTSYAANGKHVLRDLNLDIRGGEKIGICGRTGAGKSSITLALFRILEATQGRIVIDGQDIRKVGLTDLRSRLTIIPQDPMLFQGTLRENLDPHNQHDDAALWRALEQAGLKETMASLTGGLDAVVTTGGNSFSAGQRQLMALASALLRKQRIVVFDEATSATDAETDALVQRTIRTEFKDCTVLTIAHRIATIMDSDRILVLDQGQVLEFDTPRRLLADSGSAFAQLVGSSESSADLDISSCSRETNTSNTFLDL